MFIYSILILILVLIIIILYTKREHFIGVRNVPTDISNQNRKKFLMANLEDDKKSPFYMENDFLLWDDSLVFRNDITTSKNTYTPNDLEAILKRFVAPSQYKNYEFTELPKGINVDTEQFLEIVDNLVNMFMNAIYYDLFQNPDKPKYVMCPNINLCRIILIDKKIVRIRRHKKEGFYRWDVLIELALYNKAYSYGILVIVENDKPIDLKIIGIHSEDIYQLKPNYPRDPQLMITWDPLAPYTAYKGYYRFNERDSVLIGKDDADRKKMAEKYLSRQQFHFSDLNREKPRPLPEEYSCYESYGKDRVECENNYDTYYHIKKRGVWDRNCHVDEDCPFYKSNKNYPNTFGGCIEGKCEMPMGIKRLGNRYFDVDSKPMCYNCPIDNPHCCDEQKSPDYRFTGDIYVRKMNEQSLNENGLKLT